MALFLEASPTPGVSLVTLAQILSLGFSIQGTLNILSLFLLIGIKCRSRNTVISTKKIEYFTHFDSGNGEFSKKKYFTHIDCWNAVFW